MTTASPQPRGQDTERGLRALDGYLLWQAEVSRARREAEEFARRLPWLTATQHEELTRHYEHVRLADSERTLRRIETRCRELRTEYTDRYRVLRRRLACAALLSAAGLLFVISLLLAYAEG